MAKVISYIQAIKEEYFVQDINKPFKHHWENEFCYSPLDGGLYWRSGLFKCERVGTKSVVGYRIIRNDGRERTEHQMVWELHGNPPARIYHINGIKDDNRIENLAIRPKQTRKKPYQEQIDELNQVNDDLRDMINSSYLRIIEQSKKIDKLKQWIIELEETLVKYTKKT